jgi:hypothetical protein
VICLEGHTPRHLLTSIVVNERAWGGEGGREGQLARGEKENCTPRRMPAGGWLYLPPLIHFHYSYFGVITGGKVDRGQMGPTMGHETNSIPGDHVDLAHQLPES